MMKTLTVILMLLGIYLLSFASVVGTFYVYFIASMFGVI